MINTNELRLDNWVFGRDPGSMGYGKIGFFQVYNIEEDRVNVWRVEGFSDESAICEPIPLTPEILEKCGFKKDEYEKDEQWLSPEIIRVQPYTKYRLGINEKAILLFQ